MSNDADTLPENEAKTPAPNGHPPNSPRPGTYGDTEFAVRQDGWKIKIDRELCIGAASCVALAPDIFELDSEGIAIITNPDGETLEALMEGAKSCPTNAIIVEDADGNQVWP